MISKVFLWGLEKCFFFGGDLYVGGVGLQKFIWTQFFFQCILAKKKEKKGYFEKKIIIIILQESVMVH